MPVLSLLSLCFEKETLYTKHGMVSETRPLEMETVSSALAFRQYVQDYQLSLLDVALTARVRYMTLWNMAHGLPIRPAQAAYVRMGLQKLTGVAYTASIVITSLDTGTNS